MINIFDIDLKDYYIYCSKRTEMYRLIKYLSSLDFTWGNREKLTILDIHNYNLKAPIYIHIWRTDHAVSFARFLDKIIMEEMSISSNKIYDFNDFHIME